MGRDVPYCERYASILDSMDSVLTGAYHRAKLRRKPMPMDDAQVASELKTGIGNRRRLIDADAHIDPPYEFWAEYLPEHLRQFAPRIEEEEDCDYVVFEGKRRPVLMINNQAGRDAKNYKMKGKISEQRNARSSFAMGGKGSDAGTGRSIHESQG